GCHKLFEEADMPPDLGLPARLARYCFGHYYEYYDDYDLVLYPLMYQAVLGEAAKIDVIRISPEDAERECPAAKLARTAYAHFGAFLDRGWRKNDMLWGRLDGAQRLIAAILPDEADRSIRNQLTNEAHEIILAEELNSSKQDVLTRILADAMVQVS